MRVEVLSFPHQRESINVPRILSARRTAPGLDPR
jgi:hypothetical protein